MTWQPWPHSCRLNLDINFQRESRRRTSCQVDPEPSSGPWEKGTARFPVDRSCLQNQSCCLLPAAPRCSPASAMRVEASTSLSISIPLDGISGIIANPSVWRTYGLKFGAFPTAWRSPLPLLPFFQIARSGSQFAWCIAALQRREELRIFNTWPWNPNRLLPRTTWQEEKRET